MIMLLFILLHVLAFAADDFAEKEVATLEPLGVTPRRELFAKWCWSGKCWDDSKCLGHQYCKGDHFFACGKCKNRKSAGSTHDGEGSRACSSGSTVCNVCADNQGKVPGRIPNSCRTNSDCANPNYYCTSTYKDWVPHKNTDQNCDGMCVPKLSIGQPAADENTKSCLSGYSSSFNIRDGWAPWDPIVKNPVQGCACTDESNEAPLNSPCAMNEQCAEGLWCGDQIIRHKEMMDPLNAFNPFYWHKSQTTPICDGFCRTCPMNCGKLGCHEDYHEVNKLYCNRKWEMEVWYDEHAWILDPVGELLDCTRDFVEDMVDRISNNCIVDAIETATRTCFGVGEDGDEECLIQLGGNGCLVVDTTMDNVKFRVGYDWEVPLGVTGDVREPGSGRTVPATQHTPSGDPPLGYRTVGVTLNGTIYHAEVRAGVTADLYLSDNPRIEMKITPPYLDIDASFGFDVNAKIESSEFWGQKYFTFGQKSELMPTQTFMVGPVPIVVRVTAQPTMKLSGMGSLNAVASLMLNVKGDIGFTGESQKVVGYNFKEAKFYSNSADFGRFVNNLEFSWDYELVGSASIDITAEVGIMIIVEVNGIHFRIFPAAKTTAMIDGQISLKPDEEGCHGKIDFYALLGAQVTAAIDFTQGQKYQQFRRMLQGDTVDDHLYTAEENDRRSLAAEQDSNRQLVDFWSLIKATCRTAAGDCDGLGETCAKAVDFIRLKLNPLSSDNANWDGRIYIVDIPDLIFGTSGDKPIFELPTMCDGQ